MRQGFERKKFSCNGVKRQELFSTNTECLTLTFRREVITLRGKTRQWAYEETADGIEIENQQFADSPPRWKKKRPQTSTPDSEAPQTYHKAYADEKALCGGEAIQPQMAHCGLCPYYHDFEDINYGYPREEDPTAQGWDAIGTANDLLGQWLLNKSTLCDRYGGGGCLLLRHGLPRRGTQGRVRRKASPLINDRP